MFNVPDQLHHIRSKLVGKDTDRVAISSMSDSKYMDLCILVNMLGPWIELLGWLN